jgi:hypothetical protein
MDAFNMDRTYAPYTGFGLDPDESIKFTIGQGRGGTAAADWTGGEPRMAILLPENSNDAITQFKGREPRTVQWRLWFESRDDLMLMDSVQGRYSTLRYKWGLTSTVGGVLETIDGIPYLKLERTLLLALSDQQTEGEQIEATATFWRTVGNVSVAGFATALETGG